MKNNMQKYYLSKYGTIFKKVFGVTKPVMCPKVNILRWHRLFKTPGFTQVNCNVFCERCNILVEADGKPIPDGVIFINTCRTDKHNEWIVIKNEDNEMIE